MKIQYIINIFRDSLLKNSIYLIATNFVTSIIGFFFWIIAARYYSPADIGITSALFSSITLISTIGSLGLNRALIFYLPRDQNTNKIINSCLTISVISTILISIMFVLGLKFWSPKLLLTLGNTKNTLIFVIVTTALAVSTMLGSTFTAGRRSSFKLIKDTIYHIVKILPLIFFVSYGAMGIIASINIGVFLSTGIGFILLFKTWKCMPRITLDPIIKKIVNFSVGNYISDGFNNLPKMIFPILILNIISETSAGYFYMAITMAGLLHSISLAVSSSFLVESSDKDRFWSNVNKSINFNMIVLVPGLISFMLFGKFVLNIFSTSYGQNATITMIILTVASIPISLVNIFISIRNSQNRIMSMIEMNILIAIISIVLSMLLIKSMNIEGVAISYLIANMVGALIVISKIKNPKAFTLRLLKDINAAIQ
jgi:O-antigen/teichoic acid export membrane protein